VIDASRLRIIDEQGNRKIVAPFASRASAVMITVAWAVIMAGVGIEFLGPTHQAFRGQGEYRNGPAEHMIFFILLLASAYLVLTIAFNRTVIDVSSSTLSKKMRPIFVPFADIVMNIADVEQIQSWTYSVKGTKLRKVVAGMRSGRQVTLFADVDDEQVAREIAGRLLEWVRQGQELTR